MRLANKVALVTGAARGIGRAIAQVFRDEGATVAVCDLDAQGELAWRADISREDDVRALFAALRQRFGRLDVLVNNAGVGLARPVADTTLEEWNRVIGVNLTGTFLCCREAAGIMSAQRSGSIVNLSSITAETGGVGRGAYGASKSGVNALTRVLAVELAPFAVRVNAIQPGPVATELAGRMHDARTVAEYKARIPFARYGSEEEIARVALFLASDEASYVTGQALNVDGGFNMAGLLLREDR
jgi:3-oxoacyl-[acyl-carrier protein] reductase